MRKIAGVFCTVLLIIGWSAGPAQAQVGKFRNGVYKYKYFNSHSGDSGTCGPDWANDVNVRVYKVDPGPPAGSYHVVAKFKKGTFTTVAGPSPESCQAGNHNTVAAGVTGSFFGTIDINVSNGVYNPSEDVQCASSDCLVSEFVTAAFGSLATYTTPTFNLQYTTADLTACAMQWINASPPPGNSGDIATTCAP